VISFTPLPLYPQERVLCTHWIGVWVGPRAGLDDTETLKFLSIAELEFRPLGGPACSESLYRLIYRSPFILHNIEWRIGSHFKGSVLDVSEVIPWNLHNDLRKSLENTRTTARTADVGPNSPKCGRKALRLRRPSRSLLSIEISVP
jgi:hypothetical protein